MTPSNYNGYNISCFGSATGSINLTITGGTSPYTIIWSNAATTEDLNNVPAGYYRVTVDDADTLTEALEAEITLTQPEPLTVGEATPYVYQNGFNVSAFGACNGSVVLDVRGGVTPYTYFWEPGQQSTGSPTNLCAYENQVLVTDDNGCTTATGVGLSEPERDDWTMTGNYNTNPANQFIGTLDNKDLHFKTNNSQRFKISSNGDIIVNALSGSGSRSLYADSLGKLIAAPCFSWATCGNNTLTTDFLGTVNQRSLAFKTYTSNFPSRIVLLLKDNGEINIPAFSNGFEGFIFTDDQGNLLKKDYDWNLTTPPKFLNSTGNWSTLSSAVGWDISGNNVYSQISNNVGIGTNTPGYKLEINHNTSTTSNGIKLRNISGGNKNSEIKFCTGTDELWAIGCDVTHNGADNFFIYDNKHNSLRFIIDNTGKIGIGTQPPTTSVYKLFVEGGIATREIKIQPTNWPDFVFSPDYELLSISELKIFIEKHKHLPEIPSQAEIQQDQGYEIGKLQTLLLQKIEEQTLYIINLQEQINLLNNKIENLMIK